MTEAAERVLHSLNLDNLGPHSFQTSGNNEGWEQVFGGQLIAQSLRAASLAQRDLKQIASVQLSFIARAELRFPLTLRVEMIRDGSSFDRVQVFAEQNKELRSIAIVTFHQYSASKFEHQAPMPDVPDPMACADLATVAGIYRDYYPDDLPESLAEIPDQAVETRFVNPELLLRPEGKITNQGVWVRFSQDLQPDLELHKAILGYISDQSIVHVALQPHPVGAFSPRLRLLSLDHAISFHRPFRADEWLLLVRDCASLCQGLASVNGSFFSMNGDLVAGICQNAYIRVLE